MSSFGFEAQCGGASCNCPSAKNAWRRSKRKLKQNFMVFNNLGKNLPNFYGIIGVFTQPVYANGCCGDCLQLIAEINDPKL